MSEVKNKTALVPGARSGMGYEVASFFAAKWLYQQTRICRGKTTSSLSGCHRRKRISPA
jgi:hypothetical protein